MAVSCYLAMTAAEIRLAPQLPSNMAYMACHFSPYTTGLSNIPDQLPPGSILILNDRTPINGHVPDLIAQQLAAAVEKLCCSGVLLDFERPGNPLTAAVANAVVAGVPCPAAVSRPYADGLTCPIFLSAPLPNQRLAPLLAPWKDREIWLEAALDAVNITVTAQGSHHTMLPYHISPDDCHCDNQLHCRYRIETKPNEIVFSLYRCKDMLADLLAEAEQIGITKAVGLYQQLGSLNT